MKGNRNHIYVNTNLSYDVHHEPYLFSSHCLHYLCKGQGFVEYDGKKYSISQGQGFFIPKASSAALYPSNDEEWSFIWLNLEGEILEEIIEKSILPEQTVFAVNEKQAALFEEILLQRRTAGGNPYLIQGLAIQLLSTYIDNSSLSADKQRNFDALLSYIHKNLHEHTLNIPELLRLSGYNRTELYSYFKQKLHCSPAAYIRKSRLDKARHLLCSTRLSIRQIAHAVGIEDPLYFSRLFRKWCGISPLQFRVLSNQKDFDFKQWQDQKAGEIR